MFMYYAAAFILINVIFDYLISISPRKISKNSSYGFDGYKFINDEDIGFLNSLEKSINEFFILNNVDKHLIELYKRSFLLLVIIYFLY